MKLLALDPGKSTGWAKFDGNTLVDCGVIHWEEPLWDWLSEQAPNVFVVEDYIIRAGKAAGGYQHQWGRGETLQIIGAVKFQARRAGALLVLQQPSIKPAAYARLGQTFEKGKKNMHAMDAIAHGAYYIRGNVNYCAE